MIRATGRHSMRRERKTRQASDKHGPDGHAPKARRMSSIAFAACVLLAGCTQQESEQRLIESAQAFIYKKENNAAIIQLKTALQQNPNSGRARYLLGTALLKSGKPTLAVVEFQRALALKEEENDVLPPLAQALVASGEAKKVTALYDQTRLENPRAMAILKTAVAQSHAAQGRLDLSQSSLDEALQLDPKNVDARMLRVRLMAERGEVDQALSQLNNLLNDEPRYRDGWFFKGHLLLTQKKHLDEAAGAFKETIAIEPKFLLAHAALASLALKRRDIAGFKAELAQMKSTFPGQLDTRYFEVQEALVDKDFKKAREIKQQLLVAAPESMRVQQLSGAVELADGGSLALAEASLAKAVQMQPASATARRLLAETYLRQGQPARALTTLQPVMNQHADAATLALVGRAFLQNGQLKESEAYFNKAVEIRPDDVRAHASLALTQLAQGNVDSGFAELEGLATQDPTAYADYALIAARMSRNDWANALKDVDRLHIKEPNSALTYDLRGQIQARLKDIAGARASFEKAVAIDPVYIPAIASLAMLDMADKRRDSAISRFEQLLAREPKNYRALLALAEFKQDAGAGVPAVRDLLTRAVQAEPTEIVPRLTLIKYLLAVGEKKAARAAADDAATTISDNPQILDALGQVQLADGGFEQAVSTFNKVAALQPTSLIAHMRLAQAYLTQKNPQAARRSLNRVLEIDRASVPAQSALIQIALAEQRYSEALQLARTVQKQRPSEATGYTLEAEVQVSQQRWEPAVVALRTSLERRALTETAVRLHGVYLTAGKTADAGRVADGWLHAHPTDIVFLSYLGAIDMDRRHFAAAEARYRSVLSIDDNNVNALNNLAWTMSQQGKTGALRFAQKANNLASDQPALMDTLAAAMAADGQVPQAVELQRKAVAKAGEKPEYRLRLAKLLIKSGDRAAARHELQMLTKLGDKFLGQAEVGELLKQSK